MKISQIVKDFKGRKGNQVERRRGRRRRWERGAKGMLQAPPASCRTQALWNSTPGLQRREDWNSVLTETRTEPEFEFSAKRR